MTDAAAAERLFRYQVIALLRDEGLLSHERIELLLSWRNSGFSVHNGVTVAAGDTAGIERLACVPASRPGSRGAHAARRQERGRPLRSRHASGPAAVGHFAPADFLALTLQHVPEPRLHQVRYYGHYANAARARRAAEQLTAEGDPVAAASESGRATSPAALADQATETDETALHRRQRRLWAQLLRRVYEVDPLTCRQCGEPMRVVAFIQEPAAIRKILAHLERRSCHRHPSRDPPLGSTTPARAAR